MFREKVFPFVPEKLRIKCSGHCFPITEFQTHRDNELFVEVCLKQYIALKDVIQECGDR